ncbi:hypothetical protein ACOSQ3_033588 [Xanthoceras sorbifolium]
MLFSTNILMADFPPNLEDGELWLPSDVIHEITSSPLSLPPPPPPPPPLPTTFFLNTPAPNLKVHHGDGNHVTAGDGCFYGVPRSSCTALYGGIQLDPPPVHPPISPSYPPIPQPTTQGLEEKGGTGVFLPRAVVRNRGGFFNNQKKNKKISGKSEGGIAMGSSEEGVLTEKDKLQSHHPTEKLLPKDWTY